MNLFKGASILLIVKSITMIFGILSAMFLTRYFTVEEYGLYSQIMLIVVTFSSIFGLGLPNSTNYFLASYDTKIRRKKFLSVFYLLCCFVGFIVAIIILGLESLIISYFDNENISKVLIVAALLPLTKYIDESFDNILITMSETIKIAYFRIVKIIFLIIIIALLFILKLTIFEYLFAYLMVEIIFCGVSFLVVNNLHDGLNLHFFSIKEVKKILTFSLPLGLATGVGTLNIKMDNLFIAYIFDTEQLAIYTNMSRELPIALIATSLTAVLMPEIVRFLNKGEKFNAISVWGKVIEVSYIVILCLVCILIVFSPEIVKILYSDKYIEGVNIFRIYILLALARVTYFGMILNGLGKTKVILNMSILTLILNMLMNVLLIYLLGIIGPAVATVISIFIINLLQLIMTCKTLNVSFKIIFPWGRLFKITIINILFFVIFSILLQVSKLDVLFGSILESFIIGVVWITIYTMFMLKRIRFLTK